MTVMGETPGVEIVDSLLHTATDVTYDWRTNLVHITGAAVGTDTDRPVTLTVTDPIVALAAIVSGDVLAGVATGY